MLTALFQMEAAARKFTVSATRGKHMVQLTMMFPDAYPVNTPPEFKFGAMTTLSRDEQTKLVTVSSFKWAAKAALEATPTRHTMHS